MMADINISMDVNCSQCGAKGATQSGVCLDCIRKRIKEGMMPEIKTKVVIDKLKAAVKIVEEREGGEVVDHHLVTKVTIQYEGTPAKLEKVLWALRSGHTVDVTFSTPQLGLGMPDKESDEEKEPVLA